MRITLKTFIDIKEGKNTLRWDKTSCRRFAANEARLKMGFLAYHLLHLIHRFYLKGEETRWPIEWISMRMVKVGTRIAYDARYWYVHVAWRLRCRTITGRCLAVLIWYVHRNSLKKSERRDISKIYGNMAFKQVLGRPACVLAFDKLNFYFEHLMCEKMRLSDTQRE